MNSNRHIGRIDGYALPPWRVTTCATARALGQTEIGPREDVPSRLLPEQARPPDNYPVILPDRLLRRASDHDLAEHYGKTTSDKHRAQTTKGKQGAGTEGRCEAA